MRKSIRLPEQMRIEERSRGSGLTSGKTDDAITPDIDLVGDMVREIAIIQTQSVMDRWGADVE